MKIALPALTKKRLRWLLDHAYDLLRNNELDTHTPVSAADSKLLSIAKSLQRYNLDHRADDCRNLFPLFSQAGFLDQNSDGTTYFLAMVLALKDLCSLSEENLQELILSAY